MNDIAKQAEEIVLKLESTPDRRDPDKKVFSLTTSQLRRFLSAVNSLKSRAEMLESEKLDIDTAEEVKYLKIKLAYQAGREKAVKDFAKKSNMFAKIDEVGDDRKSLLEFTRLVEGIVAYHRYYGGKD